ncbi:MAG: ABC transporter ATP-binding protein [Pseudomonas sp.]
MTTDGPPVAQAADEVIRLDGVSKVFRMYGKPHHRFIHGLLRARADRWYGQFQALDGINVTIRRGETVGIVGRNGSGKSTLLQVICGILQPTNGTVTVNGRVAALLELGAGFNPDFTGRENIYLNAAVLGLSRNEVDARFGAIVAFADIGDFIEQPVKTYSSGMYIRLAFAVAINTDPQILIIDEALSVGDEAFQRKCFARIEELKRSGCTILFVSHSAGAVVQLCDRAVLLDAGELIFSGPPKATVALYQRLLYAPPARREALRGEIRANPDGVMAIAKQSVSDSKKDAFIVSPIQSLDPTEAERFEPGLLPQSTVAYESRGALIEDPHLVNAAGSRVNVLTPGRPYRYRYRVRFTEPATHVHFGMLLKSLMGVELFGMASHPEGHGVPEIPEGAIFNVEFFFNSHLLPGTYFMNAGVMGCTSDVSDGFLHRILDAVIFKVEPLASDRRKVGFYDLALEPACIFGQVRPEPEA